MVPHFLVRRDELKFYESFVIERTNAKTSLHPSDKYNVTGASAQCGVTAGHEVLTVGLQAIDASPVAT